MVLQCKYIVNIFLHFHLENGFEYIFDDVNLVVIY